jgi:uncharacterized protein involved in outer membrane biogenesis
MLKLTLPRWRSNPAAAAAPDASSHPSRLPRIARNVLVGLAVLVVLFAVVGFFVVPPVARHYLVQILGEQLGRKVSIADISVNPFTMRVSVKGFAVQEPAGAPAFVSIDEVLVNASARSIWRLAPVLTQIRVVNPYLHVVRNPDGSTYNFSDLVEKFSRPRPDARKQEGEARFSLNNIELVNGRVEFDDKPQQMRHTVSEIHVAVPFVSNLPDTVEEYVHPSFSARVNGTPVAVQGQTKPFKDTLETSVDVNIDRLDLTRYIQYVPAKLNFRLGSGLLDTRLTASFVRERDRPPAILIRGKVGLEKLSVAELDGKPLMNLAALTVPVDAIDVFGKRYEIGAIAFTSPEVFVRRSKDGQLNWMSVVPARGTSESKPASTDATSALKLSVKEVAIHDGQVHVQDLVPAHAFSTDLTRIQAAMRKIALPQSAPAEAELAFHTRNDESVKLASTLQLQPLAAEGTLEVEKVRLKTYAPYYEDFILYRLEDGVADLRTGFAYRKDDAGAQMRLTGLNLGLASVRMRKPGANQDFLRAKSAQIRDAEVDVGKLALTVGQFTTREGFLNVVREPDGALNATRILPAPKGASTEQRQGTPWLITLKGADIEKWKVAYTDQAVKEPVRIVASDLRFRANGITNQKNRRGQVTLQARLNESGVLKVSGPLAINPVATELDVELAGFGLVPLQPYFTDKVNLLLTSADLALKGKAALAPGADGALNASYKGDLSLTDFAAIDKAKSEDLLKWRALNLSAIDFTQSQMALSIDAVALADFYARIIVFPEGRLNLQDIAAKGEPAVDTEGSEPAAQPQPVPAKPAANDSAGGRGGGTPAAASTAATKPAPQAPAPSAPAKPVPPIRIAKVTLQGGEVNFTDLFIKPNYSANLTDIGGAVTGLSSELDTTADVDLRGRFAKTAPVQIAGKVNPLVHNLFLDIKADVRDIELGPFTPYSGKYVGYAIEKGKMSFAVQYKVENRKLAAQNKLVLNQLTFGDKVESPQAIKLPVLLAVSLLKDRNGVIDVNLPISGSLDDPKFSVGGIIWSVIVNLIEKAVTAPFALIGNLLGGGSGEELSYVDFEPGRALLSQESQDKLAKLQTALVERPGLKLDISGRYDAQSDREGLRRYRFEQQVKAQKLKDVVKKGSAVKSVDEVQIEPAEYEKYLERAYKAAKFPKPRNALGFTKDLPKGEMEKLMLASTQVTDDDLNELANQRAQAAKDYLTREDKVPLDRVFLLAPKPADPAAEGKGKPSRVEFALK